MIVHLVRAPDGEYDIEASAVDPHTAAAPAGFWARLVLRARARWADVVQEAEHTPRSTRWGRWRSQIICHLNESAEEQRSLWALRDRATATLIHPAHLTPEQASDILQRVLAHARRHHSRWLIADLVLFVASGLLMLLPGPNLVAYYFAFRVIGHYLAWRGARQALDIVAWTFEPGS